MKRMKLKQISLDVEWVELIKQARTLGVPMEEIRRFLRTVQEYNNVPKNLF
ncbi:anti-repressor SinI family protein [Virgibacillus proomii]|nr:anti-repressor SinI family protein [Virgibacillus proomii]